MAITIREASVLLGGSEQWVRSLCKRNIIGEAWSGIIDYHRNIRAKRLTYHIVPGQLAEYMRISEAELDRRLEKIRYDFIEVTEDGEPTGEILKVPKSCELTSSERSRIESNMDDTDREIAKLRSEMWKLAKGVR